MTNSQENYIKNLIKTRNTSDLMNEVTMFNQGMITSSGAASRLIAMLLECPEKEEERYIEMPKIKKGKVTVKVGDRVESLAGIGIVELINGSKTATVKLENGNLYRQSAWTLKSI
jgi:hypothetical protein